MIQASRRGKTFTHGGIGMHPDANLEKDEHYLALLPSLGNDIRLHFMYEKTLAKIYMKDI
jgi:hypothetical protein